MFVCRVAAGAKPDVTLDGATHARTGAPLWTSSEKRGLVSGAHLLVAETGGAVTRFREFVVFDEDAIRVDFLLALTPRRTRCECGSLFETKSVVKDTENRGRPCLVCQRCNKVEMLPACFCGKSAKAFESGSGANFFRCRKPSYLRCDFFQRNEYYAAASDARQFFAPEASEGAPAAAVAAAADDPPADDPPAASSLSADDAFFEALTDKQLAAVDPPAPASAGRGSSSADDAFFGAITDRELAAVDPPAPASAGRGPSSADDAFFEALTDRQLAELDRVAAAAAAAMQLAGRKRARIS